MKPLIVANWKMNPQTSVQAKRLFNSVKKGIKFIKNIEVVICPPFTFLSNLKFQMVNVKLGAQDCFWENSGAFTGEVSPTMLKNLGCQYVILGHSERRRYFNETDEMINKKIKTTLLAKLKPILCIGETEKQRKAGKTVKVLKNQLKLAFRGFINPPSAVIIAYEPVWAIGTGKACRIKEAKEVSRFLKKNFKKNFFLYGGSVNAENARDYILKAGFDGLLIGGASLDDNEFIKIIKNVSQNHKK